MCKPHKPKRVDTCVDTSLDFGNGRTKDDGTFAIEPGLLGFVNSSYQLGSIFAVPLAPWFAQRYGRRWSIMLGSLIMVVGALLQGFSQHGEISKVLTHGIHILS